MMRLFAVACCCLVTASPALPGTCAAVEHDPIEAGDLARFLPAFAKVAPDTPIAPAPSPEMRRVFRPAELLSIAHGLSLQLDSAPELCFAWPVEPLDRERSIDAMKAALAVPDAHIEIVEASANPVPRGTIVFRREDLAPPALTGSRTPVLWRGNVLYGANRRFAIWARVLVTARLPKVIAAVPLRRGQTISPSQVRIEQVEAFPEPGDTAHSLDQVAGRVARRDIPAGSEIHLGQLEIPCDIARGDAVQVEVRSGAAHLAFTARALSDGHAGDLITLRNLRSNKSFQARVNGKDRAFVDASLAEYN